MVLSELSKIEEIVEISTMLMNEWSIAQIPLARHVSTRYIRCVEPMHFSCVELLKTARLDKLILRCCTRRTCRVESTWRAKWNLGLC